MRMMDVRAMLAALSLSLSLLMLHVVQAANSTDESACLTDASISTPVLLSDCSAGCGYTDGFCAYYPKAFKNACTGVYDNRCRVLATCAFECFGNTPSTLYFYDSPDELLRAGRAMLIDRPTTPFYGVVNVSLVPRLKEGAFDFETVYFLGQPARTNAINADAFEGPWTEPQRVLDFKLPDSFFKDASKLTSLQLTAIPAPLFPKDFVSDTIRTLRMDNCAIANFPWTPKNVPKMDSMISITDSSIEDLDFIDELADIFVYNNKFTSVPKALAKATELDAIILRHNPLKQIPAGSLPHSPGYDLQLKNCSLTEVPQDITKSVIRSLDISYNPIGDKFSLAQLPSSLTVIKMGYTDQTKFPSEIKTRTNLTHFDFSGHPKLTETDLDNLPINLQWLKLQNCGLTKIPPALAKLKSLQRVDLRGNEIAEINAEDFPLSAIEIFLSGAKFTTLSRYALSRDSWRMQIINISHSALSDLTFIPFINTTASIYLVNNSISTFPNSGIYCQEVDLSYNQLTKFDGIVGATNRLDLSFNQLTSFEVDVREQLQSLYLRGNKLTTIPDSVFSIKGLRILDLRDNPIEGFAPTASQLRVLQSLALVLMDASQLAPGTCNSQLHIVCTGLASDGGSANSDPTTASKAVDPSSGTQQPSPQDSNNNSNSSTSSSTSTTTIAAVAIGFAVLVLIIAAFIWFRYKQNNSKNNSSTTTSTSGAKQEQSNDTFGTTQSNHTTITSSRSILDDDILLKNRLDSQQVSIQRVLAAGSFGEVFLAQYHGDRVVVKRLKDQANCSRKQIAAFAQEIKLLASFQFPKIVHFIGVVWTKESDLGVVTEYMRNGDLRNFLSRTKRSAHHGWTKTKLRMALDICEAVVYLHSLDPPLIHRDLKSLNVLLDGEWNAYLSDFGSSRELQEDASTLTWGVGTALWMAPEVVTGGKYGTSADVYSLGVILSELDTHLLPYESWTATAPSTGGSGGGGMLSRGGASKLQFLDSCPAQVRALAMQCAAQDPLDRPTAMAVAYELRKIQRMEDAQRRSAQADDSRDDSIGGLL